jgi:hypothetical protein
MVEISFVKRFLYCLDNYYIWPLVFYWKVHFIAMFNLSPITTIRMIMAMNDVTMQNMFLLTNNILAHKRCVKAKAWFLIELFFFFLSTHGTLTLVNLYTYVELNKDTIVECSCDKSRWQWWHVNYCWHGMNIFVWRYILTCHQNSSNNI